MRPAEMGAREAIQTGSEQQSWRLGIRGGRETTLGDAGRESMVSFV